MADPIATYERNRTIPAYQPASLAGQAAAVNAIGRQAALTAAQGEAESRQIAVIAEPLGKLGMKVGTELAQQRGMAREIESMRDKEGKLVPRTVVYTLNLEQQVYNKRADAAFAMEALYDFNKEADRIAQEHSQDPEGYERAVTESLGTILAKTNPEIRDRVEGPARSRILQQRQYLDTERYRGQRTAQGLKAEDAMQQDLASINKVIERDGTIFSAANPHVAHEEIIATGNAYIDKTEVLSATKGLPAPALKDQAARQVTTHLWKSQIGRSIKQIKDDPDNQLSQIKTQKDIRDLREKVIRGDVKLPGWKDGESRGNDTLSFLDLNEGQQQEIMQSFDRAERGELGQVDFNQKWARHTEHTKNYQKDVAVSELAWKPASPQQEQFQEMVHRDAQVADVDPILASSIMGLESAGNPSAVSHQGARGLMQMLPETAIGVAKDMATKGMSGVPQGDEAVKALKDPRWAIALGTHYLGMIAKQVEREHPGLSDVEYHAAIAFGYHQGPEAIPAWFKASPETREALLDSYQATTTRADWKSPEFKELDAQAMKEMGHRPAGMDYVRKVVSTWIARTSGEAMHYKGRTRAIQDAYGGNPEMEGPLLQDLVQTHHRNRSMNKFTQEMFQAPGIWDPRYADQWAQMRIAGPGPQEIAQSYESFAGIAMTDISDIQLAAQEAAYRAAGGTMAGVRSRGGKITPLEEVRGNFDQGVAMQLHENLVMATGENYISDPIGGIAAHMTNPQTGELDPAMMPAAVEKFVNRYAMGNKTVSGNLQGMVPSEAIVFGKNLLNAVTSNQQIQPAVMQASQQVLRQLTHTFDPTAMHGNQSIAQLRMRNMAKVIASQMPTDDGKNPSVADVMTALNVVANSGDRLTEQRPGERRHDQDYVRALLNGEGGDKAYRKLKEEDKQLVDEHVVARWDDIIDNAGAFMLQHGAPIKGMATPKDLPPMVKQAIMAEVTRILPMMSEDQMENLGIKAAENLVNRGELGWTQYGAQGIEPTLASAPVEGYLRDGQEMDMPVIVGLNEYEGMPNVKVPRADQNGRVEWEEVPAKLANPVLFVEEWVRRSAEVGHDMSAVGGDVVERFRNGHLSLQTIGEIIHPSGALIPVVALKSRTTTDSSRSQGWTFIGAFPLDIPVLLGGKTLDSADLKRRGMGDLVDSRGTWQRTQSAVTGGTWFALKRWAQGGSEFRRRAGISTLGELQGDPRASTAREAYNLAQGPTMFQRAASGFMELFNLEPERLTSHPDNEPIR